MNGKGDQEKKQSTKQCRRQIKPIVDGLVAIKAQVEQVANSRDKDVIEQTSKQTKSHFKGIKTAFKTVKKTVRSFVDPSYKKHESASKNDQSSKAAATNKVDRESKDQDNKVKDHGNKSKDQNEVNAVATNTQDPQSKDQSNTVNDGSRADPQSKDQGNKRDVLSEATSIVKEMKNSIGCTPSKTAQP